MTATGKAVLSPKFVASVLLTDGIQDDTIATLGFKLVSATTGKYPCSGREIPTDEFSPTHIFSRRLAV